MCVLDFPLLDTANELHDLQSSFASTPSASEPHSSLRSPGATDNAISNDLQTSAAWFNRLRLGGRSLCGRFSWCIGLWLGGLLRFLGGFGGCCSFGFAAIRRSPKGEVVAEELHDQRAVPVRFLRQGVEFSNRIIESLLGKMAGAIRRVQDLVVKDGEVERKTKADGMRWGQLGLSNIGGVLEILD